ncbi:MAG TPA: GNAT family N-acetyltransferase [Actinomycetota bacterium]|jgi:ribosomal protein S18 acetylase RimI-like enzyme|nr:GNAT family N-acetyltransferase [Actinomycetota bacterium]
MGPAVTRAGRPAIRTARADDLGRLGPLYEAAGFGARLAGVVGFARARLEGEVMVAEAGGALVGVAAGAVFVGTGWVGGVAVVPAHRRAGLGGALTEAIVGFLEGRGVATALLHATALGRPVYERLGFVPETAYLTLTGPTLPRFSRDPLVRPGRAADLEAVVALDLAATGEDRRRLLAALWPAGGLVAAADGRPLGYHLASPWRSGGATIAADPGSGLALLDAVRAAPGDEVSLSVPAANPTAVQFLEAAGFSERYRTIRMHRGPRVPWDPATLFGAHNLFWG